MKINPRIRRKAIERITSRLFVRYMKEFDGSIVSMMTKTLEDLQYWSRIKNVTK